MAAPALRRIALLTEVRESATVPSMQRRLVGIALAL